jgi:hypothetical protein
MGSLAMWGAMAGAGEGGAKYFEERQRQEGREKLFDLETARAERLETIRGQRERELQQQGNEAAMARTQAQLGAQQQRTETELKSRERIAAEDRAAQMDIAKGRDETSIRVAEIGAEAKRRAASAQSGVQLKALEQQIDSAVKRYEPRTFTQQELTEYRIPVEKTTQGSFDRMTNTFYAHIGDKAFPAGGSYEPKVPQGLPKEPTPKMIKLLMENPTPEMENEFLNNYGYLPTRYFEAKLKYDLDQLLGNVPTVEVGRTTAARVDATDGGE